MVPKRLWHVRSKWRRHLGLTGSETVRRHIPATSLLSRQTLSRYLKRYREIYVKPVYGSYGNRIVKVTRTGSGYALHHEQRVRRVRGNSVQSAIFRHARRGSFMIQQGVRMIKPGGRPCDFRVLLLRPGDRWLLMGIMGKQATGNRVVTNFRHGGRPVRLHVALRDAGWNEDQIRRTKRQMADLAMAAAVQFTRRYPHCRRLGIDIAVDTSRRLWILEVNTNPEYELFRHHETPGIYSRIHRLTRAIRSRQSNR